ncbi:hypothetical protein [Mycobacterium sp. 23]|uniref:hypothetical protein n=1 Tax=Mycobacterium sp. 23 TaxID=3400424 RepID=UPI003AAC1C4F
MTARATALAGRVVERLHRVHDLLAVAQNPGGSGNKGAIASVGGEVVAVIDPDDRRLVRLTVSPLCMTGCTAGQLEAVINAAVVAAIAAASND